MTAPTPRSGDRFVRRTWPGKSETFDVMEWGAVPQTGELLARLVASDLMLTDADLLAHGRGELARLRAVLEGMLKRWGQHSGSCCVLNSDGCSVVTEKSCKCDPLLKQARAALAGRAAGGEGPE